jgi:hypothetical protein
MAINDRYNRSLIAAATAVPSPKTPSQGGCTGELAVAVATVPRPTAQDRSSGKEPGPRRVELLVCERAGPVQIRKARQLLTQRGTRAARR